MSTVDVELLIQEAAAVEETYRDNVHSWVASDMGILR